MDNTAGQRPKRHQPIVSREGKALMQFVWHGVLGNQMGAKLTYLKQFSLFTSALKAMTDKGEGNMLA